LLVQTSDVVQLPAFAHGVDEVHTPAAREQKEVLKALLNQEIDDVI
jgi:hypothetical protein